MGGGKTAVANLVTPYLHFPPDLIILNHAQSRWIQYVVLFEDMISQCENDHLGYCVKSTLERGEIHLVDNLG